MNPPLNYWFAKYGYVIHCSRRGRLATRTYCGMVTMQLRRSKGKHRVDCKRCRSRMGDAA